jgi:hypothetical protein
MRETDWQVIFALTGLEVIQGFKIILSVLRIGHFKSTPVLATIKQSGRSVVLKA